MRQTKGYTFLKILFQFCLILLFFIRPFQSYASVSEGIQVYQKNLHLSLEHKQKITDTLNLYHQADNIWDILREEFSLPHYENNPLVQSKIQWYMNNQDFLLRSTSRAAPYLYYILQQVKKRHLPVELVLLPIIESGYNPFSLSNMGAAGIWQLMPQTATGLGVRQDNWYDGRRDVIASTRAALNHLAYLQSFFDGNWLLAIAAYNTGEGNVLSAIRRNIRNGIDTEFWSLPVAQQTRDYVPSLLALAAIISHPDQYPIYFPPIRNAPYLAEIDLGESINLKNAASLAGLTHQKLLQLNPGFNQSSRYVKGPQKLILPIENIYQFSENYARAPSAPPLHWRHYRVQSGDTLFSIARKFNTTPHAINQLNRLGQKNTIHRGVNLLIPKTDLNRESDKMMMAATKQVKPKTNLATLLNKKIKKTRRSTYELQSGDTVYIVRNRDTLFTIAKRFHISTASLKQANRIHSSFLNPGRQLIIPTHLTPKTFSAKNENKIQAGDTIYMVRKGDTLEKIARRFKTTAAAIRVSNLMGQRKLTEGESLIIPTHLG